MTGRHRSIICVLGVVIVLMASVVVQQRLVLRQARIDNAEVRRVNAQLAGLNATRQQEQNPAFHVTVDSNELQRLRDGRLELMRLRGEVGLLRRQLAEMTAAANEAKAARLQQVEVTAGPDFSVQYDPAIWKPKSKSAARGPLRSFSWDLQGEGSVHISAASHTGKQTEEEFKKRQLFSQKFRGDPAEFVLDRRQVFGGRDWYVMDFHNSNTRPPRAEILYYLSTAEGYITVTVIGEAARFPAHRPVVDAFLQQVQVR